ncbi:MAG: tetraacyldisaccharide 4'-kinase, partial [Rikenellaceae bacterium]
MIYTFVNKLLLFPLYYTLKFRHFLFDKGIFESKKFDIPIISIGNISMGGTGKTPHTEFLIKELLPKYKVAVLSRGYGRKTRGFRLVEVNDKVSEVGDEPLQMKKKFADVIVAVCEKRVKGVETLLVLPPEQRPTVILLDDAFQHRWISPKTNIVLVDYSMPLDKEFLFPIGRLRDLPEQIQRADIIIVTKCPDEISPEDRFEWGKNLRLSSKQKLLFSNISYGEPDSIFEGADRRYIYSKFAILITAIANPLPLIYHLLSNYRIIGRLEFRDHHNFTSSEVSKINRLAKKWPKA